MNAFLSHLKIQINDKIYVKDPESTDLGKRIVQESIILIDEIGFEDFTFKKLGERIGSNESSVYRYFDSKHKLLIYLCCWYWGWIEYRLAFSTANVADTTEKLKRAITVVTDKIEDDSATLHINEAILNKIIIEQFTKTLLTKEIDEENKEGFFLAYKRVVNRIVDIVGEANPNYPYAKSLASSIVEGSLHQHFLKDHLKTITDCSDKNSPADFYNDLVQKVLNS